MKKILQAFKGWLARKIRKRIYVCDSKKADGCSKQGCWWENHGPCKCTKTKRWAKLDEKGKPVIAKDMDLWNEEYYEYLVQQKLDEKRKQWMKSALRSDPKSQKKQGL